MLNDNLLLADDGYNIQRSLRFRSSASAYLNRTPGSAGDSQKWTWSGWVKRGTLGARQGIFVSTNSIGNIYVGLEFLANDKLAFISNDNSSPEAFRLETNAVFRDLSAWYHILVFFNTSQATSTNRAGIYVNNVLQSYSTANYMPQNYNGRINTTDQHSHGSWLPGAGLYFDGYLAEVNFINSQALTPSSFGETSTTTGVWIPKKYTGTYGTNGFYLPFTDVATTSGSNAGLGKDFSGNGNYWTTNNISVTSGSTYDSMKDVPTLTDTDTANYCVINPISNNIAYSITNGNLSISNGSTQRGTKPASFFLTSGKWYWEAAGNGYVGAVCGVNGATFAGTISATGSNAIGYWEGGIVYWDGGNSGTGASYTSSDTIGIALDMDSGTVAFYKNNTLQYTATFGSGTVPNLSSGCFPCYSDGFSVASKSANFNFGQRPFAYTPPTGFKALNTFNLPTPTIGATASSQANKYFDATLYTGNSTTQSITNAGGFQPDLVWVKDRTSANSNALSDSVRGRGRTLITNATNAESALSASDKDLISFNSNGFSVGQFEYGTYNQNSNAFVAWQWRASNTTAVTNTSGSITSTVSANTTAGFSIVTYTGNGNIYPTGATVGHGLGVAPSMIVVKQRSSSTVQKTWIVYHSGLGGANKRLNLNDTSAVATDNDTWNNTSPTSTVFSIGAPDDAYASQNNVNGKNYVAYCFAQVAGYSAFGSYTGNGSTDGAFVFTGFRPRFVLIKKIQTGVGNGEWYIQDTARDNFNQARFKLYPSSSVAENGVSGETTTTNAIDILSNGFKLRTGNGATNESSISYIYAAFAESPFKYSLAR